MTQRIDYFDVVPELFKKFAAFQAAVSHSDVARELGHLVMLRASQLNGCAFCVDMHVKEATLQGERALRLFHVSVWRESPLFSARERAALAWTELLTRLPVHGIADADYAAARQHFSEAEISALSWLIVAINGWNRMSVAFQRTPGSADAAFGLDKAGLR